MGYKTFAIKRFIRFLFCRPSPSTTEKVQQLQAKINQFRTEKAAQAQMVLNVSVFDLVFRRDGKKCITQTKTAMQIRTMDAIFLR